MANAKTLKVNERSEIGSRASHRRRQAGFIPANIYGLGKDNRSLEIEEGELRKLVESRGRLVSVSGPDGEELALVQEIQFDAFGDKPLHIDLLRITETQPIMVKVPVRLDGIAVGRDKGGKVRLQMHEVLAECTAHTIPDEIVIDISQLDLGHKIRVRDIACEGYSLASPRDGVIVRCGRK